MVPKVKLTSFSYQGEKLPGPNPVFKNNDRKSVLFRSVYRKMLSAYSPDVYVIKNKLFPLLYEQEILSIFSVLETIAWLQSIDICLKQEKDLRCS